MSKLKIKGKTLSELREFAVSERAAYWPSIVVMLVDEYRRLYAETEKLREAELFAPHQIQGKPPERNGV